MIFKYKGKEVSNSLSVFNYYKAATGKSIEKDLILIERRDKVLNDSNSTDEEIDKALDLIDPVETIQFIYYAMRCAADNKTLDVLEVINEIEISDINDGTLMELVAKLIDVKKNQTQSFLKQKKR